MWVSKSHIFVKQLFKSIWVNPVMPSATVCVVGVLKLQITQLEIPVSHRILQISLKVGSLLFAFQSASSCVLRDDAVPTIFDSTMPVNNQSICNRKRARDPVSVLFNL